MNGLKAKGKTIGEVEKLTGIPKRELKYFIEQRLLQPSQKSESGYWLYSGEDIKRARLAALCRELDIPVRAIRVIPPLAAGIRTANYPTDRQGSPHRSSACPCGGPAPQLEDGRMGKPDKSVIHTTLYQKKIGGSIMKKRLAMSLAAAEPRPADSPRLYPPQNRQTHLSPVRPPLSLPAAALSSSTPPPP